MRIVQINDTCGTGSIGRSTYELACALEQNGIENYVFYSSGTAAYQYSVRIGNSIDRQMHALLSRITGLQGYFSRLATLKLIKQLKKINPDIVHFGNLHSNYINLKLICSYLAKNNIATVLTLHDCWLFTGKCTYYLPAPCDKWQHECGNCPLLHRDNVNPTYIFDTTRKCLNDKKKWLGAIPRLAVVGVSKWVAEEAKKSIYSNRNPIAIYNWIDLETFHHRESQLREELGLVSKFVILVVATNLNRIKGYDELVGLAENLPENWTIIAIGTATLPLPANVIHISHTNDAAQLAEYYSMADVCLNVTKYETFGKVTAEAICCGTPAVVYNNTASPELVAGGCGEIVDMSEGMDGVWSALKKVEQNGKASYTENCIKAANERFTQEIGVQKYIDLYKSMIENKK